MVSHLCVSANRTRAFLIVCNLLDCIRKDCCNILCENHSSCLLPWKFCTAIKPKNEWPLQCSKYTPSKLQYIGSLSDTPGMKSVIYLKDAVRPTTVCKIETSMDCKNDIKYFSEQNCRYIQTIFFVYSSQQVFTEKSKGVYQNNGKSYQYVWYLCAGFVLMKQKYNYAHFTSVNGGCFSATRYLLRSFRSGGLLIYDECLTSDFQKWQIIRAHLDSVYVMQFSTFQAFGAAVSEVMVAYKGKRLLTNKIVNES